MRILISAYACEPDKGSEPGVGWNLVKEIGKNHEVWVITRTNNKKVIDKAIKKEPLANVHFHYYDLPRWLRSWKKGSRGIYLYYYLWQVGIFKFAKKLNQQVGFDIAHHITFVSCRFPSFLSFLGLPFIWGPIAGGENSPFCMRGEYTIKGRILEKFRDISQKILRFDPFVRFTMNKSALILTVNNETRSLLPKKFHKKILKFPAIGMSRSECEIIDRFETYKSDKNRLIIVSAGELVDRKAFGLALTAISDIKHDFKNVYFKIIGKGPKKLELQKLCDKLGISENVEFSGSISRYDTLKNIKDSDIFLFPSLRDSGGFVLLEAMAAAKPVICLDIGGPGEIVSEDCGIKITVLDKDQVRHDLADALKMLASNPDVRNRMGLEGRKRVEAKYMWKKKGKFIDNAYRSLKLIRKR